MYQYCQETGKARRCVCNCPTLSDDCALLQLSNVNDKLMLMASKKKLMEAEIASKLEAQRSHPSDSNQASLVEALSRFKDLYADYGKQRKQEVSLSPGGMLAGSIPCPYRSSCQRIPASNPQDGLFSYA